MKQLSAIQYDPGTAVSKATSSLLAMTALDTTNLRSTVTVPKSGRIYWKIQTTLHGATTYPQVMLGVLEGASVRARKAAMLSGGNLAATTVCAAWAEGTISGLTPGASFVADAAYGVETVVASTGLKYGGPNNTTGNDAWGAISFELWDPDPYNVDAAGNVQADVREVNGTAQTAGDLVALINTLDDFVDTEITDIRNRLPAALVSGRMDCSVGAMAANVLTASAIASDAITDAKVASDVTIASVTGAVGSVTAAVTLPTIPNNWITAAGLAADVTTELQAGLATAAALAVVDGIVDDILLDTAVIGAAGAGLTAIPWNASWDAEVQSEVTDALNAYDPPTKAELDSAVSPLATAANLSAVAGYLDTEVAAILAVTNALPDAGAFTTLIASIADLPTNAELATALAGADDAVLAAIGDLHDFDPATDEVMANVKKVNDVTVAGDGQPGSEWGPA